jgi:hypothetical protein
MAQRPKKDRHRQLDHHSPTSDFLENGTRIAFNFEVQTFHSQKSPIQKISTVANAQ